MTVNVLGAEYCNSYLSVNIVLRGVFEEINAQKQIVLTAKLGEINTLSQSWLRANSYVIIIFVTQNMFGGNVFNVYFITCYLIATCECYPCLDHLLSTCRSHTQTHARTRTHLWKSQYTHAPQRGDHTTQPVHRLWRNECYVEIFNDLKIVCFLFLNYQTYFLSGWGKHL